MLSPANSGAIDVHDLEPQAPRLKAERDSLRLEVYSVDMQGATSERLQSMQTLCMSTNGPTTRMQTGIDGLTSARDALGTEVQAIGDHAARLPYSLARRSTELISFETIRTWMQAAAHKKMPARDISWLQKPSSMPLEKDSSPWPAIAGH